MKTLALSVFAWLAAGSFAFADVRLSFRDGQVSIVARDATVGQILTEWAKIGQTTIVNVERTPRAPLTIELENVSEGRALDVVLRELSGYIAAPRAIAVPNASQFDRIIVVPPGSARMASAGPPAKVSASAYQAPASPQQESAYQAPYQTPASARQPSAYQAPASVQQPSAYQPAYPQQQAAFEPPPSADDTANDVNDQPASATVGVGVSNPDQRGPVANTPARQALETIDPRTFRLEMLQPQKGLPMVPPSGGMLRGGGVAVPGMIAQPKPPPR